jgi:glycosyltransferase involved in cell wall biosynthesis
MKIVYITAGAAGMYCGSCFRDNTLATELIARGHDVMLVPLYTPTLTDENNVSQGRVFFGGISVYLQQRSSIFRHTPWLLDRLWDSPGVLKAVARRSIQTAPQFLGELTVSMLQGEHGHQRKELWKLVRWLQSEGLPDLVNLSYSLLIGLAQPLKEALGRPLCCTLQGEDLFLDGLQEPHRTKAIDLIRANVHHVDAFIAVSDYYKSFMTGYLGIPPARIHVVPLGINMAGYMGRPHGRDETFTVGYFARVAPEKGLHLLAEAYHIVRQRTGLKARLEVAGYLAPEHREYLRRVEQQMADWGLGAEFSYRGAPGREQKLAFLRALDVMSVPFTYPEPKGLSIIEAMADGVPVVEPNWGSMPEIVRMTSGGILVTPNDPNALAEGLLSIWMNPDLAAQFGRQGAEGVRRHYSAAAMADAALDAYNTMLRGREDPASHRAVANAAGHGGH